LGRHIVECLAQPLELVIGANSYPGKQVAGCDLARCHYQSLQWNKAAANHVKTEQSDQDDDKCKCGYEHVAEIGP